MVAIKKLVRKELPRIPYEKIAERVLGKRYALSLVFCGETTSQNLNTKYRNKNRPTNVLSFPLSNQEGEIFITLPVIKKEAKKLKRPLASYTAYIFIHGLLHLKGHTHGSTMEREERKFLRDFGYTHS